MSTSNCVSCGRMNGYNTGGTCLACGKPFFLPMTGYPRSTVPGFVPHVGAGINVTSRAPMMNLSVFYTQQQLDEAVRNATSVLSRERDALKALLSEFVDNVDECEYDHHGYCQTHGLHERPCAHERAKAILR